MAARVPTKKKKPGKKRKASLVIFTIELIALLILVVGVFAYARINDGLRTLGTASGSVGTTGEGLVEQTAGTEVPAGQTTAADPNFDADAAAENTGVSDNAALKGYTNIAFVGIDTRDNRDLNYANSDTMIIASINNDTGHIRMVSIYRDTLLNIGENLTYNVRQGDADDGWDIVDDDGGYDDADDGGYDDYDDGGYDDGGYDDGSDDGGYDDGSGSDGGDGGTGYDNPVDVDTPDTGTDNPAPTDTGDNGGTQPAQPTQTPEVIDAGTTPDTGDGTNYYSEEPTSPEDDLYTNNDDYNSISDATLPDTVSYQLGATQADGNYDKANSAYQNGSAKQLLSMLNKNLDLNIHEYVVVDFTAVAKLIDDLDGITVWMTKQEVVHMNNYCKETSKVTGMDYEEIIPEEMPANYNLNGVQAVSYARIRYTTGNDMKRTQRQRVVIQKIAEKAKQYGLKTVQAMLTDVFPYCKTSLSAAEIISMATNMFSYEIEKTTGFPFEHLEKKVYVGSRGLDCVVPVTLESNVRQLHSFLFDEEDYEVSDTVKLYSEDIETLTNLTEANRESAAKNSVIGLSGGEADIVK